MNKKELYEQPNVSVFTVQTEGVICQSFTGNSIDNGNLDDWTEGGSILF